MLHLDENFNSVYVEWLDMALNHCSRSCQNQIKLPTTLEVTVPSLLLLARLELVVDQQLPDEQAGFRHGRLTITKF